MTSESLLPSNSHPFDKIGLHSNWTLTVVPVKNEALPSRWAGGKYCASLWNSVFVYVDIPFPLSIATDLYRNWHLHNSEQVEWRNNGGVAVNLPPVTKSSPPTSVVSGWWWYSSPAGPFDRGPGLNHTQWSVSVKYRLPDIKRHTRLTNFRGIHRGTLIPLSILHAVHLKTFTCRPTGTCSHYFNEYNDVHDFLIICFVCFFCKRKSFDNLKPPYSEVFILRLSQKINLQFIKACWFSFQSFRFIDDNLLEVQALVLQKQCKPYFDLF